MTKALMLRVLRETYVDTAKYRYSCHEAHDNKGRWLEFCRVPLKDIGTSRANYSGEVIKVTGWRPIY